MSDLVRTEDGLVDMSQFEDEDVGVIDRRRLRRQLRSLGDGMPHDAAPRLAGGRVRRRVADSFAAAAGLIPVVGLGVLVATLTTADPTPTADITDDVGAARFVGEPSGITTADEATRGIARSDVDVEPAIESNGMPGDIEPLAGIVYDESGQIGEPVGGGDLSAVSEPVIGVVPSEPASAPNRDEGAAAGGDEPDEVITAGGDVAVDEVAGDDGPADGGDVAPSDVDVAGDDVVPDVDVAADVDVAGGWVDDDDEVVAGGGVVAVAGETGTDDAGTGDSCRFDVPGGETRPRC